jgi:hypothetical protein
MFGLGLEQNPREEMSRFRPIAVRGQQEAAKYLALLLRRDAADFRRLLRQLCRPRPLNECEQCRQLPDCDVQVELFPKSRFDASGRKGRERNGGAQRLLEFEDVPIEG